jgi:hypothetical protein
MEEVDPWSLSMEERRLYLDEMKARLQDRIEVSSLLLPPPSSLYPPPSTLLPPPSSTLPPPTSHLPPPTSHLPAPSAPSTLTSSTCLHPIIIPRQCRCELKSFMRLSRGRKQL